MRVAPDLLDTLDMLDIREGQRRESTKELHWPWSRMTAFQRVQEVIQIAGIAAGPRACPKRHAPARPGPARSNFPLLPRTPPVRQGCMKCPRPGAMCDAPIACHR